MRRYERLGDLHCRLFRYLLHGGIDDGLSREELRQRSAAERRIDQDKGVAINLDVKRVPVEEVRLPNSWR